MTSLPRERQASRRSSSAYRLGRQSLLRPGCFISFGSIILGVSGLLIFFGPSSSNPQGHPRAEPAKHADSTGPLERTVPRRSLDRRIQEAAMSAGRRNTLAEGRVSIQMAAKTGGAGSGGVSLRGGKFAARRDTLSSSDTDRKHGRGSSIMQRERSTVASTGVQQALSSSEILAQVALDGGASSSSRGTNVADGEGGGTTVDFDSGAYGPERYACTLASALRRFSHALFISFSGNRLYSANNARVTHCSLFMRGVCM